MSEAPKRVWAEMGSYPRKVGSTELVGRRSMTPKVIPP